jgi:hypothetical protein
MSSNSFKIVPLSVIAVLFLLSATPAGAQSQVKGSLTVAGKAMPITQVYAFTQKGFFDPQKDDVVLLMCDAAVPPPAIRDLFARGDLVKAGKLHCVEQTLNSEKQVINFKVQTNQFPKPESGGSTEQVFDATTFDGKTIAGRAYTKSPQKSFDDVPYSYDITVSAAIEPKK